VLHGQSDLARGGRFALLKRAALRLGTRRTVFVSRRLADELRGVLGIAEDRVAVIANGIDLRRFEHMATRPLRDELGLSRDQILVGAVGNIRGPKSYATLLQAAARLCARSDRYHFAIAGEGSGELYTQLLDQRRTLQLEQRVSFLGLRSDIPGFLRSCDVYALSSITEGFSIACVEAMAAGVPVVATRSGGPEEILEHERTGLLVATRDPEALAAAIERVALDAALCDALTRAARARVVERYTLEAMLSGYARLLHDVTGAKP
jgi:glycosyltransferase involved in cell wall biosynthesis